MENRRPTIQFDLYLDESGEFSETSNVPDEKKEQDFPSQFAGFLVPRGDIKAEAQTIFEKCAEAAYGAPRRLRRGDTISVFRNEPANLKGEDLKGPKLVRFIRQLINEFQKRPAWEPVRIVNEEAACYGGRVAAYTNIFADLFLRIMEQKSIEEPLANISIQVFCTTWMRDGFYKTDRSEYENRLQEYLKFLEVRRGLAAESSKWTLDRLVLNLGRNHPALRIADILSNSSLGDFRKLGHKSPSRQSADSRALIAIFGDRNWTMTVRELFERVSILVEEYSFGMALIALAETLGTEARDEHDRTFLEKAQTHIAEINRRLALMGARGRDPQLATVLNWLDQVVGHQRLTERGYWLAQWLLREVVQPLSRELKDDKERETIVWFEYGVRRWALTAANHEGKLFAGEDEAQAMRKLARILARQWERAPILFDGLIAQAVHLTDAFEFDRVSKDMRLVAKSLETQADLFSNYQGAEFPDAIKFDLRAKAMGTLVQSEMLKGLADPVDLREVRKVSDAAIEEFTDPNDKARQYQYRCHLETLAGEFASARRYLIWSIRKGRTEENDFSHAAVARLLSEEAAADLAWQQDFAVSHWLRLGSRICLTQAPEQEKFLRAFDASDLSTHYTASDQLLRFPIHNILRFVAVIKASRWKFGPALAALGRLHHLDPIGKNEFSMALVLIAAQAEVSAFLWKSDSRLARSLIDNTATRPLGLRQLFERLKAAHLHEFPCLEKLIDSWQSKSDLLLAADVSPLAASELLFGIGSEIRY
jgi:hypothetical protein